MTAKLRLTPVWEGTLLVAPKPTYWVWAEKVAGSGLSDALSSPELCSTRTPRTDISILYQPAHGELGLRLLPNVLSLASRYLL